VDNSAGVEKGVKSVALDGKPLNATADGALLPVLGDGKTHEVTVVMG